jgi:hypothetical protein
MPARHTLADTVILCMVRGDEGVDVREQGSANDGSVGDDPKVPANIAGTPDCREDTGPGRGFRTSPRNDPRHSQNGEYHSVNGSGPNTESSESKHKEENEQAFAPKDPERFL